MVNRVKRNAREMAWAGASPEDEYLLNPYKNNLKHVWNAEGYAIQWCDEFIHECMNVSIGAAEDNADEEYHS